MAVSGSWWTGVDRATFVTRAREAWPRMRGDRQFGVIRPGDLETDAKKVWGWPTRTPAPQDESPDDVESETA